MKAVAFLFILTSGLLTSGMMRAAIAQVTEVVSGEAFSAEVPTVFKQKAEKLKHNQYFHKL